MDQHFLIRPARLRALKNFSKVLSVEDYLMLIKVEQVFKSEIPDTDYDELDKNERSID